jgi:hypothetical protein
MGNKETRIAYAICLKLNFRSYQIKLNLENDTWMEKASGTIAVIREA